MQKGGLSAFRGGPAAGHGRTLNKSGSGNTTPLVVMCRILHAAKWTMDLVFDILGLISQERQKDLVADGRLLVVYDRVL